MQDDEGQIETIRVTTLKDNLTETFKHINDLDCSKFEFWAWGVTENHVPEIPKDKCLGCCLEAVVREYRGASKLDVRLRITEVRDGNE